MNNKFSFGIGPWGRVFFTAVVFCRDDHKRSRCKPALWSCAGLAQPFPRHFISAG